MNWDALGGNPVPGDVGAIHSVATSARRTGREAELVQARLRVLNNGVESSTWRGTAADAFGGLLRELELDLSKLVQGYEEAGTALDHYAEQLGEAQVVARQAADRADVAARDRKAAQARSNRADEEARGHAAEAQLEQARLDRVAARRSSATDSVTDGALLAEEDQSAARVVLARARETASRLALSTARAAADEADARFEVAKRLAGEAERSRDRAAGLVVRALDDAGALAARDLLTRWVRHLNARVRMATDPLLSGVAGLGRAAADHLTSTAALHQDPRDPLNGPVGTRPTDPEALQAYWLGPALSRAGINLSAWDPELGARHLESIVPSVYAYYGDLYLTAPYLQWAGMANMIGPSFAAGFSDLDQIRRAARLVGRVRRNSGIEILAHASDAELRQYEVRFLAMQKEIFYDQAVMHEAYLGGGMAAIRELGRAGLIDHRTVDAWAQINEGRWTGNEALVAAGNEGLLLREQTDIIQDDYDWMYDRRLTGEPFTYVMTLLGEPSIPGTRTFGQYRPLASPPIESPGPHRLRIGIPGLCTASVDNPFQGSAELVTPLPDGNLAVLDDRWSYVQHDTLPAFHRLLRDDPGGARAIIGSDVRGRIDEYRLANRVDTLARQFADGFDVDFEQ